MGKFTIKPTNTGYVFNLKAGNGEVIAVSQVYKSLDGAKNGIASVQTNAPIAPVEDQTVEGYAAEKNPKFEIYEIIATGEGYTSKSGCKNGIESIRKNAPDAAVVVEE